MYNFGNDFLKPNLNQNDFNLLQKYMPLLSKVRTHSESVSKVLNIMTNNEPVFNVRETSVKYRNFLQCQDM